MFGSKIGKAETRAADSSTRGLLVRQHSPAAARSFGTSVKAADGDHEQDAKVALDPERADLRGLNWSLSRISILPPEVPPPAPALSKPPAVILQRKLAIGSVDDPLEHEADRVAEQVVQMPDPRHAAASAPQQISRNWVAREKDGKLQEKEAEPHEAEAPASVHEALRSPGQPLDAATRAYFEPRFGHDFSNVRVHTDDRAAESARDVSAVAYTVGRHVVFGRGLYPPSSLYGRRLLAHELAHVAQQGSAAVIVARQVAEESSQTYSLQPAYNFAEAEKEIELSETPSTGAFFNGLYLLVRLRGKTIFQCRAYSGLGAAHKENEADGGPIPDGLYFISPQDRSNPTITEHQKGGIMGARGIEKGFQKITAGGAVQDTWGSARIRIEGTHLQRAGGFYIHGGNPDRPSTHGCIKVADEQAIAVLGNKFGARVPLVVNKGLTPKAKAK